MNRRLKCVIVDDDEFTIQIIKGLLQDSLIVEVIHTFSNPIKFIESERNIDYDLCLLDIVMPEINGISIAKQLNKKPLIFITGEYHMLKDAVEFSPIDIVLKPITKDNLNRALGKVLIMNGNRDLKYELFYVAEENGKVKISLTDILYVQTDEVDRRNKTIIMKDQKKFTLMDCKLQVFLNLCPNLIQVNKSELISIESLYKIENDLITLEGVIENGKAKQVTLGRTYRKAFLRRTTLG
jgi:two-component system LytT family response regulator